MQTEVKVENLKVKTRLDNFLASYFPNITRSTSKKIIIGELVMLNGKKAKPNAKLNEGDIVSIDLDGIREFIDTKDLKELIPVEMKLDIIFEDENTIILNKPSGVVVHPSYMHNEDSLMNGLTYYIIHKDKNPFTRIRPVHRLDRDTSGIILFSKNLDAHNFYSKQFKNREVEKTYITVVKGNFQKYLDHRGEEHAMVKSFISKDATNLIYKSTNSDKGDYAETEVHFAGLLGEEQDYSLLRVLPHTGRTHQIRVHLHDLGYPILGDEAYGGEPFKRLMLHAWKLKFKLFEKDEFVAFETAIPQEYELTH